MDQLHTEGVDQAPGERLLQRRSTRRALVMGTAGLAAAGAASAVIGVATHSPGPGAQTTTASAGGSTVESQSGASATAATSKAALSDPAVRAAHLLRRAGFGGTLGEIDEFAGLSREDAVSRLVDYDGIDNSALDARLAAAGFQLTFRRGSRAQVVQDMQKWWLTRMAYTARPLEERLTFTWHGLLTSQVSKIGGQRASWMVWQNELFRAHAAGRFDDLIQAVAKDPAMMMYLDTVESTKEHPNENFPRELMELFTMGEGNYTEDDVRESARAFTGWRLSRPPLPSREELTPLTDAERLEIQYEAISNNKPAFIFNAREHDGGQKAFLGRTGPFNGEDIIAIIMEQPATGRYISRRLWETFAYPDPEPEVLDRLERTWNSSNHSIRELVRTILLSDEFFSERAYRAKVRSPVEFVLGVIRGAELELGREIAVGQGRAQGGRSNFYSAMDQVLFEPPNVAGWPGGAAWMSSSTFFARMNFLDELLFPRGRGTASLPAFSGLTPEALVASVAARLVDGSLADASRAAIAKYVAGLQLPAEQAAAAVYLVAASPEFQLS